MTPMACPRSASKPIFHSGVRDGVLLKHMSLLFKKAFLNFVGSIRILLLFFSSFGEMYNSCKFTKAVLFTYFGCVEKPIIPSMYHLFLLHVSRQVGS